MAPEPTYDLLSPRAPVTVEQLVSSVKGLTIT